MMVSADPWAALDDAVLDVFGDGGTRSTGEVLRRLPDLTHREVRTALAVNVGHGYLSATRGAVHTTYTITPAGREHLASEGGLTVGCTYFHGLGTIRDYSNGRRGQTVACPECGPGRNQ